MVTEWHAINNECVQNEIKEESRNFLEKMKMKGGKKFFQANGHEKKAGVAILISDKMNFKIMSIKRGKFS